MASNKGALVMAIGPDIDTAIDAAHAAAAREEQAARQICARIRLIPGAQVILKGRRGFGEVPNPWRDGQVNISAQGAILRADPALASYLAKAAGKRLEAADDAANERERQREASIARMQAEIAAMKERNLAVRQKHQHAQTYGKQDRFTGNWV